MGEAEGVLLIIVVIASLGPLVMYVVATLLNPDQRPPKRRDPFEALIRKARRRWWARKS